MDIEITKKSESVNDGEPKITYNVNIKQHYGTGDLKWHRDNFLYALDEEDMRELAQTLYKRFCAPSPPQVG